VLDAVSQDLGVEQLSSLEVEKNLRCHTALDAVSQDITSSSTTIPVTNFSTFQLFNFSTLQLFNPSTHLQALAIADQVRNDMF